jgi:hypothetical protein
MPSIPRLVALLAALSCSPALADQFNTTQGGGNSPGGVLQRRQGTSGTIAVPVDEANPLPVAGPGTNGAFPTASPTYTPLGCRAWLAVTTGSAVLLSSVAGGIPAGATLVDIAPSVTVVMRDDGSAPGVAGPGIPLAAGSVFYPYSGNLATVQFIAQTTTGTIATCFYK